MLLADLSDSATALLGNFAAQLNALGVDVPVAQYVGAGTVPWDGESLTVYIGNIGQQLEGQAVIPQAQIFRTLIYVQIIRAVAGLSDNGGPLLNIPNADDLNESGVTLIGDAAGLMLAAQAIHSEYLDTGQGEDFVIEGVQPIGPEGGFCAMRIGLRVTLE